ncbi:MAG TPA: hypothetical protein VNJ07_08175, partial [Chitinophagales bacterium]|nr:hypothetical protein [Chitinophagales bacterium]
MGRCISATFPCTEKAHPVLSNTSAYTLRISNTIAEVNAAQWDDLLPASHLFLSRSYLRSLEESTGSEVQYRYLMIQQNHLPVALAFFQIIHFQGSNVERDGWHGEKTIIARAAHAFRKMVVAVVNKISLNILVSGNAFVTGEYGFYIVPEAKADFSLLLAIQEGMEKIISENEKKISGILVKDFYGNSKSSVEELKHAGFLEFRVNPNMILSIKPDWKSFDDYLGSMASKYRTRMKKALKRAEPLTIREMNADELRQCLPQLSSLYDEVVDEAAFKLAKLKIEYIVRLKKELGEKFGVIGFFRNDEPVTFISYYLHENDLVAGYMGMRRALNHEYDLYLNVLLRLAETGIRRKMMQVVYGRTAMEIKSSVGAVPHPMYLYVKHRSPLVNFIIKQTVRYLSREEKW